MRYKGNPIIDSNREWESNHTRDPKVLWYEPTKEWIMVLFEKMECPSLPQRI